MSKKSFEAKDVKTINVCFRLPDHSKIFVPLRGSIVAKSRFLGDIGVPLFKFQGDIRKFLGTH